MTIKLLLVDDQNLVKMGICALLELSGRINIVGQLNSGIGVLEAIEEHTPDVMLLDIRMPKMNGIEVLAAMKDKQIELPTIILTTFDEHDLVLNSIKLGAKGYLRKDSSFDLLMSTIDNVIAGVNCFQPGITNQIIEKVCFEKVKDYEVELLSVSEIQVLRLAAAGYSNKEIANALNKSYGTVRNQMSFILEKLESRDRTRAVLKAIENGII
ncbi:LuxR family transcriptional regulator [Marinomonas sp. S3726]|uniref:response regulator transcription factor n=1 Tax=Marinomonas sp. S3726 TaxID=579484 RepID=UPI0005FA1159|nr:response regulator transcription factor [Marinomonas sp. S3726]KJZ09279.1 LuxR family transcriptional regulator [Marinomonas sp. S3726]